MEELMIKIQFSRQTLPEEKAKWIARLFQTVLETMPTALEQPLHRIAEEYTETPLASATAESSPSSAAALQNGKVSPNPPSALTQAVISQAWDEVGLVAAAGSKKRDEEEEEEDRSMFSDGANAAEPHCCFPGVTSEMGMA